MKKLIVLVIILYGSPPSFSQGVLKITGGTSLNSNNGAYIVINNASLVNNGIIDETGPQGTMKFTGSMNVQLSGSGVHSFGKLQLAFEPSGVLSLNTNLKVNSELIFSGGLLDLKEQVLDLANTGTLLNESETSRALSMGSGYIQSYAILDKPSSVNPGNLGAVFSSGKNMGLTTIRRGHFTYQDVAGSSPSIQRSYNIEPANNIGLNATLVFHYFDAELNGLDENELEQWREKDNGGWIFVGSDQRNTTLNFVTRNHISKFSRWTLSGIANNNRQAITEALTIEDSKPDLFQVTTFPNPSSTGFNLIISSPDYKKNISLRVFTYSGQLLESRQDLSPGTTRIGEHYKPGLYVIKITQGLNKRTIKLIKQ